MTIPKFDPKELEVAGEIPASPIAPPMSIFSYPVPMREAYIAMLARKMQ